MERRWGAQTELAVTNFPVAMRPLDVRVARALAAIKRHAAVVNAGLGVAGVDERVAEAIGAAARQIESGELDEQFPVDVYQTGSGTSTNMNVNEVVAALAGEALDDDGAVHANDHVNASQSSNDTVPTAIRIAVAAQFRDELHPALELLAGTLRDLAARTADVVKAGRTHLMDATPVTIGQEAAAWAGLIERARRRSVADLD
ncbi:MAG: lyase family protein, partial [Actinomycetota bacterium]|nr:lyase family protein [Actinomycetota bacterium]